MSSAFLSTRRLRNLSPNTITFYSQILMKFLSFMEANYRDVSLEQIDQTVLRAALFLALYLLRREIKIGLNLRKSNGS